MKQYAQELREEVVKKMLEQDANPVLLEKQYGVPIKTLYAWRTKALKSTGSHGRSNGLSKFHMVLETAAMNEQQKGAYCREHGIFASELSKWREKCEQVNESQSLEDATLKKALLDEKAVTKRLTNELRRKESALAETAALLVLRKNIQAIFGEPEEE